MYLPILLFKGWGSNLIHSQLQLQSVPYTLSCSFLLIPCETHSCTLCICLYKIQSAGLSLMIHCWHFCFGRHKASLLLDWVLITWFPKMVLSMKTSANMFLCKQDYLACWSIWLTFSESSFPWNYSA